MTNNRLRLGLAAWILCWCGAALAQTTSAPAVAADHSAWNHIVANYVDDQGRVDYAGLASNAEDMGRLAAYLEALGDADVESMETFDRLAFWLNAYNALVVKAVMDHWPISSVMDVAGFFDQMRYRVAGEMLSLNELENQKLRQPFGDPRIHFAANCAAAGCPPLRREAYVGSRVDEQLEEQSTRFVRATTVLMPEAREIHVSKIFEWYVADFEVLGGPRGFTARYIEPGHAETVRDTRHFMRYDEYDWSLNTQ